MAFKQGLWKLLPQKNDGELVSLWAASLQNSVPQALLGILKSGTNLLQVHHLCPQLDVASSLYILESKALLLKVWFQNSSLSSGFLKE